jgi:hypothetical protein
MLALLFPLVSLQPALDTYALLKQIVCSLELGSGTLMSEDW